MISILSNNFFNYSIFNWFIIYNIQGETNYGLVSSKIEKTVTSSNTLSPIHLYEVDVNGRNTLHLLVMDGNLNGLQNLLETHSNVNLDVNDNNGQTPLNIAARHGYLEIVEVFK